MRGRSQRLWSRNWTLCSAWLLFAFHNMRLIHFILQPCLNLNIYTYICLCVCALTFLNFFFFLVNDCEKYINKNQLYCFLFHTHSLYSGWHFVFTTSSQKRLRFHALEKEMATHSSVLAWRIPGTGSLVGCHLWGRTESDTTEATQQQQSKKSQNVDP